MGSFSRVVFILVEVQQISGIMAAAKYNVAARGIITESSEHF